MDGYKRLSHTAWDCNIILCRCLDSWMASRRRRPLSRIARFVMKKASSLGATLINPLRVVHNNKPPALP